MHLWWNTWHNLLHCTLRVWQFEFEHIYTDPVLCVYKASFEQIETDKGAKY